PSKYAFSGTNVVDPVGNDDNIESERVSSLIKEEYELIMRSSDLGESIAAIEVKQKLSPLTDAELTQLEDLKIERTALVKRQRWVTSQTSMTGLLDWSLHIDHETLPLKVNQPTIIAVDSEIKKSSMSGNKKTETSAAKEFEGLHNLNINKGDDNGDVSRLDEMGSVRYRRDWVLVGGENGGMSTSSAGGTTGGAQSSSSWHSQSKGYSLNDTSRYDNLWLTEVNLSLEEEAQEPISFPMPLPMGFTPPSDMDQDGQYGSNPSSSSSEPSIMGSCYPLLSSPGSLIVWRLMAGNRVLELRRISVSSISTNESSLESTTADIPPIHFVFATSILSTLRIAEEGDTLSLHVMLMIHGGVFYRLVFPSPWYFSRVTQDNLNQFMFTHAVNSYNAERIGLTSGSVGSIEVHFADLDTICIAGRNGSLLQIDCPRRNSPDDAYIEQEITDTSYLSQVRSLVNTPMKMLNVFRNKPQVPEQHNGSNPSSQIISMDSISHSLGIYVFALTKSLKLRVFNTITHQHVKSISLYRPVKQQPETAAPGTATAAVYGLISGLNDMVVSKAGHGGFGDDVPPVDLHKHRNMVKVFGANIVTDAWNGESLQFKVAVFTHTDVGESSFVVIDGEIEPTGLLRRFEVLGRRDAYGPVEEVGDDDALVDFAVVKLTKGDSETDNQEDVDMDDARPASSDDVNQYRFWTLWNRNGDAVVRLGDVLLNASEEDDELQLCPSTELGKRWITVSSHISPPDLADIKFRIQSQSVAEVFQAHIFDTDLFSSRTILRAIEQYAVARGRVSYFEKCRRNVMKADDEFLEWDNLKELVEDVVESCISMNEYGQEQIIGMGVGGGQSALHQESSLTEWTGFLQFCINLKEQEGLPSGLSVLNLGGSGDMIIVMRRAKLSVLRRCEEVEVIRGTQNDAFSSSTLLLVSSANLSRSFVKLGKPKFREDLNVFFDLAKYLGSALNVDSRAAFVDELATVLRLPQEETGLTLLKRLAQKYMSGIVEDNTKVQDVIGFARSFEDMTGFFKDLLAIFQDAMTRNNDFEVADIRESSSSFSNASKYLLSSTLVQFAEARLALCKDIVLVVSAIVKVCQSPQLRVPSGVVVQLLAVYQSCEVLSWFAKRRVTNEKPAPTFQNQIFLDDNADFVVPPAHAKNVPLAHRLVGDIVNIAVPVGSLSLRKEAEQIIRTIGLFPTVKGTVVPTPADMIEFAKKLVDAKLWVVANEFLEFVQKSPAVSYLLGVICLKTWNVEASRGNFEAAALGVGKNRKTDISIVVDQKHLGTIADFYEHVWQLYEEHRVYDMVVVFAKACLNALPAKKSEAQLDLVKRLWSIIFTSSLEALAFEEAYLALTASPNPELRKYGIRRFATVLCEYGQLDSLCSRFVFGDFQSEVEEALKFKAKTRSVFPLS
ncbi:hypothetical protein HDU76_005175, partial [Blyttiomyces sp. JEL0837]